MPGSDESSPGVLLLDGRGHFPDRPDHRPQGLLHPHAVDRAEQFEEFPLDLAEKADQPRRHAALHRVAFEILDRVQADLLVHLALQLAAGELGNQHFVLERPDAQREVFSSMAINWPVILVIMSCSGNGRCAQTCRTMSAVASYAA